MVRTKESSVGFQHFGGWWLVVDDSQSAGGQQSTPAHAFPQACVPWLPELQFSIGSITKGMALPVSVTSTVFTMA
jgi:hypothetical protein